MRAKQLSFLPRASLEHGGQLRQGKRKIARPLDTKQPLHLVMRSSRARGERSFLHPRFCSHVERLTRRIADKHSVRLYRYANVGNHLHLLLKVPNRRAFQAFIRELSGAIAAMILGGRKSSPAVGRFWDFLPYTRIVSWGREWQNLELYFVKNLFEAAGLLTRKAKAIGLKPIPLFGRWGPPGNADARARTDIRT